MCIVLSELLLTLTQSTCFHASPVQRLAFHSSSSMLVSIGNYLDCSIAVWSARLELLCTAIADYPLQDVAWSPQNARRFVTIGCHGSAAVWTVDAEETCTVLKGQCMVNAVAGPQPAHLTAVAFVSDNLLFTGDHSGTISAWNVSSRACTLQWKVLDEEITALTAVGTWLCAGTSTGALLLMQADLTTDGTLSQLSRLDVDGAPTALCFDAEMSLGVVSTTAGTVWNADWKENSVIRLLAGHSVTMNAFTVDRPGKLVATAGSDGFVRVWTLAPPELVMQFELADRAAVCLAVAFDSASSLVAGGYSDGVVRVFELSTLCMRLRIAAHTCPVTTLAFSHDDKVLLVGSSDGRIAIASSVAAAPVRVLTDHSPAAIAALSVQQASARGLWLAASGDARMSVWEADWARGRCVLADWITVPTPPGAPSHAACALFSPADPDVILFAAGGIVPQIQLYSLASRAVTRTVALNDWPTSLTFEPRSGLFAIGTKSRLVKLIDGELGSFQDFAAHTAVPRVVFCGNGVLLSGDSHILLRWSLLF